ncbi:MAG: 2-oxoacid:acceptor oxidoreductase family protein [Candidatus Latescibacteria bacterium]|nr:2-oxoacid:acceptor oxidoreductase family protein [Candidatus Latescibacterota bacterium]
MAKKILERPKGFYEEFERKPGDKSTTHYCPGCGHGNIHKLLAEAIEDLEIQDRTIMVSPVGCSVFVYYYFSTGNIQVAHGRAPAVATALKRANPNAIVVSYQGDGDLAAIGGNNILQAANRGEHFTVIFVNNAIYGMTGGQLAPTSLPGMKTTTTPYGRDVMNEGPPMKMAELLATLDGPTYIERTALWDNKAISGTRRAIRNALRCQMEGKGFSMVEVLSACPSGWKVDPADQSAWMLEHMAPYFPLGVKKDLRETREPWFREKMDVDEDALLEALDLAQAEPTAFPATLRKPGYANPSIKLAGFGGQGILSAGAMLANAGMEQGFHTSWIPSYGPEMRGGTAYCFVNISETSIGSPTVSHPDVLMAFNRPSLEKFEPDLRAGALLLYDSTIIDIAPQRGDIEVLAVPATKMADDLGNTRMANTIMVGAYLAKTGLMSLEALEQTLPLALKRKNLVDANRKALASGFEFAKSM